MMSPSNPGGSRDFLFTRKEMQMKHQSTRKNPEAVRSRERRAHVRSGRRFFALGAALLLGWAAACPGGSLAGGQWITLTGENAEQKIPSLANDYTGDLTITFLGDCTLGGEEKSRNSKLGFVRRIEENGMDFPFRNLRALTEKDDLTVANLEGVLTDRKLEKVKKKYNFSGPTAYTEILRAGGIDGVTLANNHSHDYGEEGYADTKAALEKAGIAWFGTDAPAVWQSEEGLLIGFLGVSFSLTGNRYKAYARQAEMLKQLGCSAIITVMHAGTEYSYTPPDNYQQQIVSRAVRCGSHLIIGHHPHVVQGYTIQEGVPVVYSLGNCSFGGTTHAKDSDALAVQAVLSFREGTLMQIALHFYPISITSDRQYNNYSPRLLTGKDAERVLEKMKKSTGTDPGEFTENEGASAVIPVRED